eukprot:5076705-Amphidinium_carterae.1
MVHCDAPSRASIDSNNAQQLLRSTVTVHHTKCSDIAVSRVWLVKGFECGGDATHAASLSSVSNCVTKWKDSQQKHCFLMQHAHTNTCSQCNLTPLAHTHTCPLESAITNLPLVGLKDPYFLGSISYWHIHFEPRIITNEQAHASQALMGFLRLHQMDVRCSACPKAVCSGLQRFHDAAPDSLNRVSNRNYP